MSDHRIPISSDHNSPQKRPFLLETPVSESAHLNKHSGVVIFPLHGSQLQMLGKILLIIPKSAPGPNLTLTVFCFSLRITIFSFRLAFVIIIINFFMLCSPLLLLPRHLCILHYHYTRNASSSSFYAVSLKMSVSFTSVSEGVCCLRRRVGTRLPRERLMRRPPSRTVLSSLFMARRRPGLEGLWKGQIRTSLVTT